MRMPIASTAARLLPIVLGQGFGLACGVAGVRLTTQLVPPGVLGRYSIFLTFTSVGTWLVYAGVMKYTARHWAASPDRPSTARAVLRAALRKTPWLVLVCLGGAVASGGADWLPIFPALLAAAGLLSFAGLAQTALQAAREYWRDAAVIGTAAVTRSFVPPLVYAATSGSVLALYGGYGMHALLFAAAGWWALRRHLRSPATPPTSTAPLPAVYEGPLFIVLAAAGWVLLGLNRWIMALWFGVVETGYFSLAANLAALVPSVLGTIFLLYLQPDLFAAETATLADRRALLQRVDHAALLHAVAAMAGLAGLHLVAPLLVGPLIREPYRPALVFLLPAGAFALAITTGLFYHTLLLAGKREAACGPVELTAAGVLIAGSLGAAAIGQPWFLRWMLVSPLVPWLVIRPLVRRYFLPAR